MRRVLFVSASFLALATLVGCPDKSKQDTPSTATPSATVTASTASSAPASDASTTATADAGASYAGKMAHCPSSVTGASTAIKDGKDNVVITVTSKDAAATADIRTRAKFLAEQAKNASPDVKHTGTGEGGGAFGRCPVVMRNTLVESKDVDGGSEITVKPKDAKELDWLKRESRDRLKELGEPGGDTAGQGKMAHCPSALDKTTTTVKDAKDGVEVTVVAKDVKDEALQKEIRARGKQLVDASKQDPASVQHKGDGSGGGGFGRCPVVLKDTIVDGKDVPGGMTFTVKPQKNATDAKVLADLRKESKDRAANFVGR